MGSINDLQYQTLDDSYTGSLNDKLKASGEPYFQGNDVDYYYYSGGGSSPVLYDNQGVGRYDMNRTGISDGPNLLVRVKFAKQTDDVIQNLYTVSSRSNILTNIDNNLEVTIKDSTNTIVYSGESDETITVADGLIELEVEVDLSVPSISITVDGQPLTMSGSTVPIIAGSGLINHIRTTGILSHNSGSSVSDVHLEKFQLSFDKEVTYAVDLDTANQTLADFNTGTHGGTQTLTPTGTWIAV